MSKVIDNKLIIPSGVTCSMIDNLLSIKGSYGENILKLEDVSVKEGVIFINKDNKALLNTYIKLVKNAFIGSVSGFSKVLNLHGVGYKVEKNEDKLDFSLGYSHKIPVIIPNYIVCEIKSNTQLVVKSASKQFLGDFVAKILKLRAPNPYKLKGVLVEGQFVRKKEGKK